MQPNPNESVPGFTDEALKLTLAQGFGAGAGAGLPPDVRFRGSVMRLIGRIVGERAPTTPSIPALFILSDGPPPGVDRAVLKRAPMFNNGLTPVEGFVWFVGEEANLGHGLPIDSWDDDTVFSEMCSIGSGDDPAIVYETRTADPEARYYPNGLGDPDTCEQMSLGGMDISIDDILAVIDIVHENELITPSSQSQSGKLWKNASALWAAKNAEELVQLYLRTGLTTAFPTCVVRPEQPLTSGRLDLEIEEQDQTDPSIVTRHAVLELKVLRAFGSTGTAVKPPEHASWIEAGVDQAEAYRDEKGFREAALCCFDMRGTVSGDSCFDHVRSAASAAKVTLRVWHIFENSKAYRTYFSTQRQLSLGDPASRN